MRMASSRYPEDQGSATSRTRGSSSVTAFRKDLSRPNKSVYCLLHGSGVFPQSPGISFDLYRGRPILSADACEANRGWSSLRADQTTPFFLVSGVGSSVSSAKLKGGAADLVPRVLFCLQIRMKPSHSPSAQASVFSIGSP